MGAGVIDGSCSNMGDAGLLVSGMPGVAGSIPGAMVAGVACVVPLTAAGGGGR